MNDVFNSAAANWRFGATAAVTLRKRKCVIERLSPATTVVEAAAIAKPKNVRQLVRHTYNSNDKRQTLYNWERL